MASEQICEILNIMSEDYDQGVYPGRNSEGLNPEWPCDPFHVLIATILSQRTRDDNTRKASDALFHRYDSVDEIADADPEEIAELVRPAGFPKQKGKAIVDCCRMLRDVYGGKVPEETEELVKLPMVGRKTAACVRSYAMCIPSRQEDGGLRQVLRHVHPVGVRGHARPQDIKPDGSRRHQDSRGDGVRADGDHPAREVVRHQQVLRPPRTGHVSAQPSPLRAVPRDTVLQILCG